MQAQPLSTSPLSKVPTRFGQRSPHTWSATQSKVEVRYVFQYPAGQTSFKGSLHATVGGGVGPLVVGQVDPIFVGNPSKIIKTIHLRREESGNGVNIHSRNRP